jgi:two-component system LytT family response regulator
MLRTVTVDDEPLARERLKLLLTAEPDVHIVSECKNGAEAIAYLLRSPSIFSSWTFRCPALTA